MKQSPLQAIISRLRNHGHHGLEGSLEDLIHDASDAHCLQPEPVKQQQVVEVINKELSNVLDDTHREHLLKEVVRLLEKRLHTDNAHKQWLAVQLLHKVLKGCTLGRHHEHELLYEVARTMITPAHANSEAGNNTRCACSEVLRAFGAAGRAAFQQAQHAASWDAYYRPGWDTPHPDHSRPGWDDSHPCHYRPGWDNPRTAGLNSAYYLRQPVAH